MDNLFFLLLVLLLIFMLSRYFLNACKRENAADWGSSVLNMMDGMNRLFCRHYHRLNSVAIPLSENEPAIIVSNHISGLDPLLILASVRRPVRFLIASEQYYRFGFTWLFRLVRCIPIDRSKQADNSMRIAIKALNEGQVLVIFPQGKIHLPSETNIRLKPGAARLANRAGCKITPVRLTGVALQGHVLSPVIIRARAEISVCPVIDAKKSSIEEINEQILSCIS